MKYVGIDPGLTGAVALVGDGFLAVEDMPVVGANKRRVIDSLALAAILHGWQPTDILIEHVHAMPKQGVSSTFRFGQTVGRVEAVVALQKIPLTYVTPAKWKRYFGLGRDKEDSRRLAIELYPRIADRLDRRKDEGRAEALLIGTYLKETRRQTDAHSPKRDARQGELPFARR